MEKAKQAIAHLNMGRTYSGREILKPGADEENWARRAAGDVTERIFGPLFTDDAESSTMMSAIMKALQGNLGNSKHYRGEEPGFWDVDGNQLLPEPRWTYADLISLGEDQESGFPGFLHDCGLPADLPYEMVIGCAGLLLVDEAITAFDQGKPWFGFWALYQATEIAEEVRYSLVEQIRREQKREHAAKAGKARHRETDEYKDSALLAWNEDRGKAHKLFKNKSAWARWVVKEFPIATTDTPLRWLRELEQPLSALKTNVSA